MLTACQKCGAANDEHAQVCYVCDASYDHPDEEVLVREAAQACASAVPEAETAQVAVHSLAPAEPTGPDYAPLRLHEPALQPELQRDAESAANMALAAPPREPAAAFEPEWKREVVHRLEAYRARRRRNGSSDHQPELPFNSENGDANHAEPEYRATLRTVARSAQNGGSLTETPTPEPLGERSLCVPNASAGHGERIEIPVMQPEFNFVLAPVDAEESIHPHAPLVPVADTRERRVAGLLDVAFLGLSYAGFLILFRALGGHLSVGKQEAIVYALTFFLFYAVYFGLFTALGGTTPGMYFRGLAVVSFDGEAPTARQLLWRSFGYLLSGGTLLLGYVWALWDEDHLTWQDRISQTYITPAPSPMWRDLSGEEPMSFSSAHDNSSFPDAT